MRPLLYSALIGAVLGLGLCVVGWLLDPAPPHCMRGSAADVFTNCGRDR